MGMLIVFNLDLKTRIKTDVSNKALGACLTQKHLEGYKLVTF